MNLLAISGSLRAASSNAALLRAVLQLAEGDGTAASTATARIDELPLFNPDLDGEGATPPAPVQALRAAIGAADAVVVVSPEYAHGVPGALKNALDWLVSGPELIGKPVGVITASPLPAGGPYAQAQLRETLSTMSAHVVPEACLEIACVGRKLTRSAPGRPAPAITDTPTRDRLRGVLAALRSAMDAAVGARTPG